MRAVVCSQLGAPDLLSLGELPDPEPGPGQVTIEVETASFNFPDLLVIAGEYQFRSEPPFAPGAEAAGTIVALGQGVTGFAVGDRVAAIGSSGAFAERWSVDAALTVPIHDGISFETAAACTMTYGTSYHGLVQRAGIQPGETMLVLGAAGGVGSAAIDIGKALGATVIAAASTEEKRAFCLGLGADHAIDYTDGRFRESIAELTDGRGVDVVYDPVGGPHSEAAMRSIAWGGRHLIVGFTAGEIPRIALNIPLLKGASLVGVFWGSFAARDPQTNRSNASRILDMVEEGVLTPRIAATLPFESFSDGFAMLASRSVMGKALLSVEG